LGYYAVGLALLRFGGLGRVAKRTMINKTEDGRSEQRACSRRLWLLSAKDGVPKFLGRLPLSHGLDTLPRVLAQL